MLHAKTVSQKAKKLALRKIKHTLAGQSQQNVYEYYIVQLIKIFFCVGVIDLFASVCTSVWSWLLGFMVYVIRSIASSVSRDHWTVINQSTWLILFRSCLVGIKTHWKHNCITAFVLRPMENMVDQGPCLMDRKPSSVPSTSLPLAVHKIVAFVCSQFYLVKLSWWRSESWLFFIRETSSAKHTHCGGWCHSYEGPRGTGTADDFFAVPW